MTRQKLSLKFSILLIPVSCALFLLGWPLSRVLDRHGPAATSLL